MSNKAKKIIFSCLAFVIIFGAAAFFLFVRSNLPRVPGEIRHVALGGETLAVDLAQTPAEQERGLSGRASLAENEGMLFVFGAPGKYMFWMKDMQFPIDIIWLAPPRTDETKAAGLALGPESDLSRAQVVSIQENARPEDFPAVYGPDAPAQYVLEVRAGFAREHGLAAGSPVRFTK